MAEYAVVLAVITLAIVTSFGFLSNSVEGVLTAVTGVFS
jgi:Flp pilus assembly pilin Flp